MYIDIYQFTDTPTHALSYPLTHLDPGEETNIHKTKGVDRQERSGTSQTLARDPSFIQQIHIEWLSCAGPLFKHLNITEENKASCLGKYIKNLEYLAPESKEDA